MTQAVEAYRGITATEEFKYLEILRVRARHDEAQAMSNARKKGEESERKKWQGVVAEKDTALAEQAALIAKLQAQVKNQQ